MPLEMTWPNLITLFRILFIPIWVVLFYLPFDWRYPVVAALFAAAAVTDWLDGYLARRLKQLSPFGEFLDPVADKLLVAVALVLLTEQHATCWMALPAALIISREIIVSALREWMSELGSRSKLSVSTIGKYKTGVQLISITLLLAVPKGQGWIGKMGYVLLYVAVALTLWSMVIYTFAAWKVLTSEGKGIE